MDFNAAEGDISFNGQLGGIGVCFIVAVVVFNPGKTCMDVGKYIPMPWDIKLDCSKAYFK